MFMELSRECFASLKSRRVHTDHVMNVFGAPVAVAYHQSASYEEYLRHFQHQEVPWERAEPPALPGTWWFIVSFDSALEIDADTFRSLKDRSVDAAYVQRAFGPLMAETFQRSGSYAAFLSHFRVLVPRGSGRADPYEASDDARGHAASVYLHHDHVLRFLDLDPIFEDRGSPIALDEPPSVDMAPHGSIESACPAIEEQPPQEEQPADVAAPVAAAADEAARPTAPPRTRLELDDFAWITRLTDEAMLDNHTKPRVHQVMYRIFRFRELRSAFWKQHFDLIMEVDDLAAAGSAETGPRARLLLQKLGESADWKVHALHLCEYAPVVFHHVAQEMSADTLRELRTSDKLLSLVRQGTVDPFIALGTMEHTPGKSHSTPTQFQRFLHVLRKIKTRFPAASDGFLVAHFVMGHAKESCAMALHMWNHAVRRRPPADLWGELWSHMYGPVGFFAHRFFLQLHAYHPPLHVMDELKRRSLHHDFDDAERTTGQKRADEALRVTVKRARVE